MESAVAFFLLSKLIIKLKKYVHSPKNRPTAPQPLAPVSSSRRPSNYPHHTNKSINTSLQALLFWTPFGNHITWRSKEFIINIIITSSTFSMAVYQIFSHRALFFGSLHMETIHAFIHSRKSFMHSFIYGNHSCIHSFMEIIHAFIHS